MRGVVERGKAGFSVYQSIERGQRHILWCDYAPSLDRTVVNGSAADNQILQKYIIFGRFQGNQRKLMQKYIFLTKKDSKRSDQEKIAVFLQDFGPLNDLWSIKAALLQFFPHLFWQCM
ncbi:hypothetical protein [Paenibacillus sp. 32O-W]|uniref:hypothetical protein n=1 Tax=Paenibacillus sp. 32O-W TaxID=1695218 RepID=UPI000783D83E|nr:hypothetical protein [Paenibacillus sp. 32O-W]